VEPTVPGAGRAPLEEGHEGQLVGGLGRSDPQPGSADEADAPKGSMYFHFPGGKEELAAAAVDRFGEAMTARLVQGLAEAPTVADAVAGILDAYVTYMERTDFRDGCAVATVALDEAATHELLGAAASRALRTWVKTVADALEAEGRAPEEAHGLATVVIATIEGTVVMSKGERSTEPFAAARDTIRRLLEAPADDARRDDQPAK
jgi:TetR/AcrR family transcriptional regulator, lmrAB and yxaGH operons repressor